MSFALLFRLADVEQALSTDLGFDQEFERFKAAAAEVRSGMQQQLPVPWCFGRGCSSTAAWWGCASCALWDGRVQCQA